ncbi:MAG TPA: sigma-54 dependent transcriptional regulator [Verrucomicrobiae bacterium]|nr:sigma-54 dependent transcriptional regulator [Verrucomicrobiae bacterium]
MAKVMVVDDEVTMVQMVTESLRADGHEVMPFTNGTTAFDAMDSFGPELVVTDMNLDASKYQGLDILQKARSLRSPALVIVITAFGSIETAVEAMKRGAYDYLEKPFKMDELKMTVKRALSYTEAVSENLYLKKQLKEKYQLTRLVGASSKMQEVFKLVERVADTDCTVLLLGESGTGKELVARALHFNSGRQFAPFIPVNCAALPENLLESEMFGHRKGAFTGAINDKKGLFEEANGGTIFLDEIGTMPAALQSRLLRVLQEKEVRRVGDNTPSYVNVRVIAATNAPLEKKIKEGTFREDLYYRLNVIPVQLPALRERRDDIPLLVGHFLKNKVDARNGTAFQVTRAAMDALTAYDWPGNVRELENIIERACVLCEDNKIRTRDLPPPVQALANPSDTVFVTREAAPVEDHIFPLNYPVNVPGVAPASPGTPAKIVQLKDFIRDKEAEYLNSVLVQTAGDKEKAAELLGISMATLYRKLAGEH